MEKKKLKRLSLQKDELINLNRQEMNRIKGGAEGPTILTITVTTIAFTGDSDPTTPPPEPVGPTPPPFVSDSPGVDNCLSEVIVTPTLD